jgi:hypothetical protein
VYHIDIIQDNVGTSVLVSAKILAPGGEHPFTVENGNESPAKQVCLAAQSGSEVKYNSKLLKHLQRHCRESWLSATAQMIHSS